MLLLSGCEEDNEPLAYPPTLVTGTASEMTRFEAVLSGTAVKNPAQHNRLRDRIHGIRITQHE